MRNWVLQAQADAGQRPGPTSDELAEIKRLKKENAELREASEILAGGGGHPAAHRGQLRCR